MSKTTKWALYFKAITDNAPGVEISKKTGVPASTISRWGSGELRPQPRQVTAVARAYGVNPVMALIAGGYLEPDDFDLSAMAPRKLQIQEFTELELAEEILRRIEEGTSVMLETPMDVDHPAWARNRGNVRGQADDRVPTEDEALFEGAVAKTEVTEIDEFGTVEDDEEGR